VTHRQRIDDYITHVNKVTGQVAASVTDGDDRQAATHVHVLAETHPVAALVLARTWAARAPTDASRERAMDARDKCLETLMVISPPVGGAALEWFRHDRSSSARKRFRRLSAKLDMIVEATDPGEDSLPQTNEPWSPELGAITHATNLAASEGTRDHLKSLRTWRERIAIFPRSSEPGIMTQRDFVLLSLLACEAVGGIGRSTHRTILEELFALGDKPGATPAALTRAAFGNRPAARRKALRRLH
jgi:hypothetical protein